MFLRTRWVSCVVASLAFSLVGGCAPDLGTPDYSIKCINDSGCPEWCVCKI
jgi:hypothetical protein